MKTVPEDSGSSLRRSSLGQSKTQPDEQPSRTKGQETTPDDLPKVGRRPAVAKSSRIPGPLFSGKTTADPGLQTRIAEAPRNFMDDVLSQSPDAFFVVDAEWRVIFVNPQAARLCDKSPDEVLHRLLRDSWPESASSQIECECRLAMENRLPVRFEHCEPGGSTWLEICAYPCDAGLVVQCSEITQRKQAEADLQRREKELTDFVENAAVGLHWVGPDGTILWANDAELSLLGYSADEYIGHNIREFHADSEVISDILSRLLDNQVLKSYRARLRSKDGSIRYVSISSNVFRENGIFVHTRCFTRDITDKHRAEEAQHRLAAMVESSQDAIITKDLQGLICSWNSGAERIFGYSPEEVLGKPVSILAVPERMNEMPNIIERILRGERVEHYETKRRTKDGRTITVSLTVSPIRDGSGKIIGASKIARDISERERAQQALCQTNEALLRANADLEQFAYSASHDLQEPLRMVVIYSEMLQKKFGGQLGPQAEQYIRFAVEGAIRMRHLIEDLLVYTRTSALIDSSSVSVEARDALTHAISNLYAAIEQSGAVITHTGLPRVHMHRVPLEQLFQNLLGNALKYRGALPPRVHVASERRGQGWLFSVSDNGIGIEPEYTEQIFGIFKRLHPAERYAGTGMGLAICRTIVERYGGSIWAESEFGKGSTFFFTILDRSGEVT